MIYSKQVLGTSSPHTHISVTTPQQFIVASPAGAWSRYDVLNTTKIYVFYHITYPPFNPSTFIGIQNPTLRVQPPTIL